MAKYKASPKELFIDRLSEIYYGLELESILRGLKVSRKTTLRVNTLKISLEDFLSQSSQHEVKLTPAEGILGAFFLDSPDLRTFQETPLYKEGYCYIQSLSSMIPPLLLNPQTADLVLDLCAAPGSKTTQMAALMQNTGQIVANDASHTRVYRLQANLEKMGVVNTKIVRSVGQGIWHEYPEFFDKVLVDVPCSMEGRINLEDPETYAEWSVKKIRELQEIQKFLLKSAISAAKVGATIVYSTCTLSPEENESVVDWVIRKVGDQIQLEEIVLPEIKFSKSLKTWHDRKFNSETEKTKRLLPTALFEGFYIAKFRKVKSSFSE